MRVELTQLFTGGPVRTRASRLRRAHHVAGQAAHAAACDDYSGLVSSRVSYMASTVVFGTVLADAALVSRVIQLDACGAPPARSRWRR